MYKCKKHDRLDCYLCKARTDDESKGYTVIIEPLLDVIADAVEGIADCDISDSGLCD